MIFETIDISLIITTAISLNRFLSLQHLLPEIGKFLDRQFIGIFKPECIVVSLMFVADTPVGANYRTLSFSADPT